VQFLHLDRSDLEKTPGQVLRRVGEFVEFHDSVACLFEIVDDIELNVSALERKVSHRQRVRSARNSHQNLVPLKHC